MMPDAGAQNASSGGVWAMCWLLSWADDGLAGMAVTFLGRWAG